MNELTPMEFVNQIREAPVQQTSRRESLLALALLFARHFAEDPVNGTEFDHAVTDALTALADRYEPREELQ